MNKKTVVVCEFTDEDKKLLNTPISSLCLTCNKVECECLSCPAYQDNEMRLKPYKDAGIYEIAKAIESIRVANMEIRRMEKEINSAYEIIPKEAFEFLEPSIFDV